MDPLANTGAIFIWPYQDYCSFEFRLDNNGGTKCRGAISLSDDGQSLEIKYSDTIANFDIISGSASVREWTNRSGISFTGVPGFPTPDIIRQRYGIMGAHWTGVNNARSKSKQFYAWYNKTDSEAQVYIAELGTGDIIFQKRFETIAYSTGSGRIPSVSLAKESRRIAVLSTDGMVRVFNF